MPKKPSEISLFLERLQYLLRVKNISKKKLAELTGIDPGTISRWNNADSLPSEGSLSKICRTTGCSFIWLSSGKGEPYPGIYASKIYGEGDGITSALTPKPEKVVMTIEPGPARKKGGKTEEQQARQETESINEEEAIEQTRYVLRSDTVYKGALHSNIRAFYQGVKREEEMAGVDEQMIEMQNKMDMMMQMLESLGAHLPGKKRDAQEG